MFDVKKSITAVALLIMLSACSSVLTPLVTPKVNTDVVTLKSGQYSLDQSHAAVLFKVQHLGLSTYVGRFNAIDAELEFDPENVQDAKLTAVIDINSLDINDESLKQDLMEDTWFDQARYPQARFSTLNVTPIDDSRFEFTGELDWRGKQQPLVMTVVFHGGANYILTDKYTLGFSATGSFKRSGFGMDAYIPLVGDEVQIEAFAEFQKN